MPSPPAAAPSSSVLDPATTRAAERRRHVGRRWTDRPLSRFFDLSTDLLCTVSPDGRFRLLNEAFEATVGVSRAELLCRSLLDFVHEEDVGATRDALATAASGQPVRFFNNRYAHRDGAYRTMSWTFSPGEAEIYAVARDVTETELAARALQHAKEQAEAANRAKSHFLASMSHELRTPLNSVIGFTNVLLKNRWGNLSDTESTYLERIRANGSHLLTLINDILDLSRIESGQVEVVTEEVSLQTIVEEVIGQVDGTGHDRDVVIESMVPAETAPTRADGLRLTQVILNLVANAIKFTERGRITVEVVTRGTTPTQIRVTDTGIGIPAHQLDRIFQPFQQADLGTWRRFGGTGLGLSICRSLCKAMHFELGVTSREGVGSTFVIDLAPTATPAGATP